MFLFYPDPSPCSPRSHKVPHLLVEVSVFIYLCRTRFFTIVSRQLRHGLRCLGCASIQKKSATSARSRACERLPFYRTGILVHAHRPYPVSTSARPGAQGQYGAHIRSRRSCILACNDPTGCMHLRPQLTTAPSERAASRRTRSRTSEQTPSPWRPKPGRRPPPQIRGRKSGGE